MNINIRNKSFETNSSSTHSFTLDQNVTVYTSITPDRNGEICLYGGHYGWEWSKYNDPLTKANYCAVYALNDSNKMEMLKGVIIEQTGCDSVNVLCSSEWESPNHGYIDHQSDHKIEAVWESKQSLKDFIFSKNSWLFTGNDNSSPPPNFYDSKEVIDKMEYTISLEGSEGIFKMSKNQYRNKDKLFDAIDTLFESSIYNRYNNHRFVFRGGDDTDSMDDARFSMERSGNGIDLKKRIVTVVRTKNIYDKDKWIREDIVEFKDLKLTVVKNEIA